MSNWIRSPWRWEVSRCGANNSYAALQDRDGTILLVANTDEEISVRKDAADLIAAAPDLYKAAKLACLNFKRADASGNFLGDDEHESWSALEKAVAKAEGRA